MPGTDTFTYAVDIDASVARVWQELTSTGTARPWLYNSVVESSWAVGAPWTLGTNTATLIDGVVRIAEVCRRLTVTFDCHWDDDLDAEPAALLDYTVGRTDAEGTLLVVSFTELCAHTYRACAEDTPVIYDGLRDHLEAMSAAAVPAQRESAQQESAVQTSWRPMRVS